MKLLCNTNTGSIQKKTIRQQFQGEVETETITEYREVTDDADFDSFGQFEAQRELAKGRLLGKLTQGGGGSSVTTKAKAKASSSGMHGLNTSIRRIDDIVR